MMKIEKLTTFYYTLLCFACYNMSNAQDYIDLVKLDYTITPSNTFNKSTHKTSLQAINGNLTLPFVINSSYTS